MSKIVHVRYTKINDGSWEGILDTVSAALDAIESKAFKDNPFGITRVRGLVATRDCVDWLLKSGDARPVEDNDDKTHRAVSAFVDIFEGDEMRCFIVFQRDKAENKFVSFVEDIEVVHR